MHHLHALREVLLADLAEDQPENDSRDRIACPAQQEADDAGAEHHHDIEHQTAADIGADGRQKQDQRCQELERNLQQIEDRLGLDQADEQDRQVGVEHRREHDPDQLRRVVEDERPGFQVMHLENGHHHRGQRAARKAERQKRDHCRTCCRVVGCFGRDHALELALAELFLVLRPAYRLAITHEGGECGADAGKDAAEEADENRADNGEFMRP